MSKAARITITVPDTVLDAVERERSVRNESRSEFFRRAAEARLLNRADSDADERYIRGYQQKPETPEELLLSESLAVVGLGEEAWN